MKILSILNRRLTMEAIVDYYKDFASIPNLISAKAVVTSSNPSNFMVNSIWSAFDTTRLENSKFSRSFLVCSETFSCLSVTDPVEYVESFRTRSPNGLLVCSHRKCAPGKKSGAKESPPDRDFVQVFELSSGRKVCSVDIKITDKHGAMYLVAPFGALRWSHASGHLVYVAEKKVEPKSFFDPKNDLTDAVKCETELMGQEFDQCVSWGEGLTDVKRPLLAIIDVASGSISTIDSIPGHISVSDPLWSPNDEGIIFAGLDSTDNLKLGLAACTNRRSAIYYYHIASGQLTTISSNDHSSMCTDTPRLSPDGNTLIWFEYKAGSAHDKCARLVKYDWKAQLTTVVIDFVRRPDSEGGFPGIFNPIVPLSCWSSDSNTIVFASDWSSNCHIISVDVSSNKLSKITSQDSGCWAFFGIYKINDCDVITASCSNPSQPDCLMIAKLVGGERGVDWKTVDLPNCDQTNPYQSLKDEIGYCVVKHNPLPVVNLTELENVGYESVFIYPRLNQGNLPLMVVPHGGPHGVYPAKFAFTCAFYTKLGFAILWVNYRGSTGFGQDSIDSLLGKCGKNDVIDTHHAVLSLIEQYPNKINTDKIVLSGGSHGGFLVLHLDFYKSCVAHNPVVNIATMYQSSDIPDWCVAEGMNAELTPGKPLVPKQYEQLWNASPIRYAEMIKTPILFLIGIVDLRVPSSQITELQRILDARGVKNRVLMYPENNHGISKVDAMSDRIINSALFHLENLKS